jgi:DNA-binding NarL/FixJ family response regulator
MTHILLVINAQFMAVLWQLDSRTTRELVMAINTGALRVGDNFFTTPVQQSACAVPEQDTVVVTYAPPAFELTPRLYQTLWGLADGKTAEEIANELNIKTRTVYLHYARLKERFGAVSIAEVLDLADEYGLI